MHWFFLVLAIVSEIGATTSMKLSAGFTKPFWAVVMTVGYMASFTFITLALKHIDLSLAYALWAGIGTAAIALIGFLVFREPLTSIKAAGILLIIAGVVLLRLSGAH